jgi:hypothetical protein
MGEIFGAPNAAKSARAPRNAFRCATKPKT